jgi:hypothetical protein
MPTKVLLPVAVALIAVTGSLVFQSFQTQRDSIISAENAQLESVYRSFGDFIDEKGSRDAMQRFRI